MRNVTPDEKRCIVEPMKAAVYERYGPPEVVELREVEKPSPGADELLIEVHAATLAAGDWRMRSASPFLVRLFNGLFRPKRAKILGFELAGRVEATGGRVSRFKAGDDVFAFTGFGFGAHAEYCCLREHGKPERAGMLATKPANLSYAEAAALPVGALTAQAMLRKARPKAGQAILVHGASGSVGTYALQFCRHFGLDATGVCSGSNLELVRSLGAREVIDYTIEDFTARGPSYDIVFDAAGKISRAEAARVLKRPGAFVSVQGSAKLEPNDLERIKELAESDELRPVIDRRYPLAEIARAHEYVEKGHKKGNVVIVVKANPTS